MYALQTYFFFEFGVLEYFFYSFVVSNKPQMPPPILPEECIHESTSQLCYMPSHWFQWNFKGSTPNRKQTIWFLFWLFREVGREITPGFSWFSPRKLLQNRWNDYRALTAMVFNRLLWEFAYILLQSLMNVRRKNQSIGLTASQWTEANKWMCSIHQNIW